VIVAVPRLRIVDDECRRLAQERLEANRRRVIPSPTFLNDDPNGKAANVVKRLVSTRRPPWLLSGLVRCGLCQGPMGVVSSEGRLGCSNRRERGTCSNQRTVRRDPLLERVLSGLKQQLLAPELVEEFVRNLVAEVNAANHDRGLKQARQGQERARLQRQIKNLLELIEDGHGSAVMVQELRSLEHQLEQVEKEIEIGGKAEPTPALHPNLLEIYRRKVAALEDALREHLTAAAAAEALRSLIDAILIYPEEGRGAVRIDYGAILPRSCTCRAQQLRRRRRGVRLASGSGTMVLASDGIVGCGDTRPTRCVSNKLILLNPVLGLKSRARFSLSSTIVNVLAVQ
jgi:site-specific DNA recombinase